MGFSFPASLTAATPRLRTLPFATQLCQGCTIWGSSMGIPISITFLFMTKRQPSSTLIVPRGGPAMMSCKPSLTSCRTSCGTRLEEGESSLKVVHMYNSWLDYRLEYLTLTNDGLCEPQMEEGKKKKRTKLFPLRIALTRQTDPAERH